MRHNYRRSEKYSIVVGVVGPDDWLVMPHIALHFPPPSKAVLNKELSNQIRHAMTQLSPMQREIFILRYHEGLSLKMIAQKLKREMGTIKSHLFFARKRLQNELRPYLRGEPGEEPENQA